MSYLWVSTAHNRSYQDATTITKAERINIDLAITPLLIPVTATERRKKNLRYEFVGLMQIPDRQGQAHQHIDLSQTNKLLSPIREHIHYHV